jgi:hypothetical protein
MYAWILQHDDRWSFIALYVTLAVVLSLWISLFWLVALVAVHYGFECVRQAAAGARGTEVVSLAFWEVKLDIALVLFALALSLYMNVVLGVLGLQAAARAGAAANASLRAGGRVLAWERAIRGVLLSADDAAQVARVGLRRGSLGQQAAGEEPTSDGGTGSAGVAVAERATTVVATESGATGRPPIERSPGWRGEWGIGDRIAIGLGFICLLLMVAAPALTDHTVGGALATLLVELHPFPR